MQVKLVGIYVCELCGSAFKDTEGHQEEITGFKKNSNGRHIAKEHSKDSDKHICYNCISSIKDSKCNF
jgi:hypothetical protein